jgi:hypothetical protein
MTSAASLSAVLQWNVRGVIAKGVKEDRSGRIVGSQSHIACAQVAHGISERREERRALLGCACVVLRVKRSSRAENAREPRCPLMAGYHCSGAVDLLATVQR